MMNFIRKVLDRLRRGKTETELSSELSSDLLDVSQREALVAKIRLTTDLDRNIKLVQEALGHSMDLTLRRIEVGKNKVPLAALHLEGMTDSTAVAELLRTIGIDLYKTEMENVSRADIYETIRLRVINSVEIFEVEDVEKLILDISRGMTAVLFDGTPRALLCGTQGYSFRDISEPQAESAIRGPRDGFNENIVANITLLRRRLHTPHLWIEQLEIGRLTHTRVGLAYIKGLADEKVIGEVRSRLAGIRIDGVLESGYLEDFLDDQPYSPFPLVLRTERPDRVCGSLLEGRVAILTDNTPFVLVAPNNLANMVQGPDDYFEINPSGTFVRLLRFFAFLISIFLPGVYVAVIGFHPELLPAGLFLRIAATREGVPFPVAVEVFAMETVFEVLREAGLRLPKLIGPAISIVGALIVGDAAIRASLVSPAIVIIVAFTAIASFTVPAFSLGITARLMRFVLILFGAVFGLFGIQFGLLLLLTHLCALRSFGLPYMYPFAPFVSEDMKDNILRLFWWSQVKRPRLIGYREPVRQQEGPPPGKRTGPGGKRRE